MKEPVWYAYKGKKYNGTSPAFYAVSQFDWAVMVEQHFELIKQEIDNYVQQFDDSFEPYFNSTLVDRFKSWKTSHFIFWSKRFKENCKAIPKTIALMEKIPGLTTLGISVLEADSHIKPHYGDTNGIIRCHLGISIPEKAPACALKVGDQLVGWEPGKLILFCDAWYHEAWNKSNKPRYVLIFDVIHPDYIAQKKTICANVRSWLDLQKFYEKYPRFRKAPVWLKIFMRQCFRIKYMFG